MPRLSPLHQLFNVEQCQTSLHTLRWHDRPLQCPRCQSHPIGQWGTYHYRPGCKRYWCQSCKRTFNDRTDTLLHRSQRPLASWLLATLLFCLACSSRRIAREGASMAGPAIAGAGGYAMPPCPMRGTANWQGRWKPMTSTTRPATRGKRNGVGRSHWGAARVGVASSVSPAGVMMTKPGPR